MNRDNTTRLLGLASALTVALFVFEGLPPSADAAHINCGDILGPGGSFVLDSDLSCTENPALTVDSATLDMQDHTITCTGTEVDRVGLRIQGLAATVQNGVVTGCAFGVAILDLPPAGPTGHHFIQLVTATLNTFIAFDIGAHDNVAIASNAGGNLNGFVIRNRANRLIGNSATSNGATGFVIDGSRNALSGNSSQSNGLDGFFIQGANNRVISNTAIGNGRSGIRIINPAAQNNEVRNNFVNANAEGIRVFLDSKSNKIMFNAAQNSSITDLIDDNPNCDANVWQNNSFATDQVAGVSDGGPGVGCIQ